VLAAYWSDFRFSARQLLRAPAFSFFAIILIALSLGSVTSIFTVIDTIFLRKLPAHNADQLVAITTVDTSEPVVSTAWPDGLSYPAYREIRAGQRVFSDVFAWTDGSLHNIEANGVLELADVMAATGNYATALGISPLLGRTLLPRDSNFSSEPAAVLSYECWKRVFGGARDVLGKSIRIEGTPYAIVGVMPPRFALRLGIPPDVTVSLEALMSALHVSLSDPKSTRFQVTGRLKVGVSLQEARAQLHTLWPLILDSLGDPYRDPKSVKSDRELRVSSFSRGYTSLRDRLATPLLILLLISGLVLLVGCANVATLMLARVSKRHQELGIRMALGASRSALIRLPLADGILICVVGALMGLLLATGLSRGLLGFIWTAAFPMVIEAMPSQAVLLLTAGLALITVLLTSIVPTYWLASHSPAVALAEVRGSGTSLRQFNVGRVLVTGQVALSLILASAAVLFVTDLVTLQRNRTGLNSKDVLVEWLNLKPGAEKVSTEALVSELTSLPSHVEAMPGVSSAGIFSGAVFTPYELFQPV
jgi:predicted permease